MLSFALSVNMMSINHFHQGGYVFVYFDYSEPDEYMFEKFLIWVKPDQRTSD